MTDSPALLKIMVNQRNIQRRFGPGALGEMNVGYDGTQRRRLDLSGT